MLEDVNLNKLSPSVEKIIQANKNKNILRLEVDFQILNIIKYKNLQIANLNKSDKEATVIEEFLWFN